MYMYKHSMTATIILGKWDHRFEKQTNKELYIGGFDGSKGNGKMLLL